MLKKLFFGGGAQAPLAPPVVTALHSEADLEVRQATESKKSNYF